MGLSRKELQVYLQDILKPNLFKDYAPNGLQIEGKNTINNLITAVTASQNIIDKAIEKQADALLVHHGFFWPGESPVVTGIKKKRIAALLKHNINLFAYHLPLDAHIEFGNNTQLAHLLDINVFGTLDGTPEKSGLVFHGEFATPLAIKDLAARIHDKLSRKPLVINGDEKTISRIGWCTGAAQDFIQYAIDEGLDAFITGEVSERTYHMAMESDICFISAGHHASERYGVQALGKHLQHAFELTHEFIDEDNPV